MNNGQSQESSQESFLSEMQAVRRQPQHGDNCENPKKRWALLLLLEWIAFEMQVFQMARALSVRLGDKLPGTPTSLNLRV